MTTDDSGARCPARTILAGKTFTCHLPPHDDGRHYFAKDVRRTKRHLTLIMGGGTDAAARA